MARKRGRCLLAVLLRLARVVHAVPGSSGIVRVRLSIVCALLVVALISSTLLLLLIVVAILRARLTAPLTLLLLPHALLVRLLLLPSCRMLMLLMLLPFPTGPVRIGIRPSAAIASPLPRVGILRWCRCGSSTLSDVGRRLINLVGNGGKTVLVFDLCSRLIHLLLSIEGVGTIYAT